jgi:Protein of unknown function (DUF1501)
MIAIELHSEGSILVQSAGSWISRLGGPADPAVPANMAVMYEMGNRTWGEPSMATFLGAKHNPFNVVGRKARERSDNMVLRGITLERLRNREQLRKAFDRFRHDTDASMKMEAYDTSMQQQAQAAPADRIAQRHTPALPVSRISITKSAASSGCASFGV